METRDTIRRLLEEDGKLLVSFRAHAGYYRVPLKDAALCAKIREAASNGKEISFTHDRDLTISRIG